MYFFGFSRYSNNVVSVQIIPTTKWKFFIVKVYANDFRSIIDMHF